MLPPVSRQLLSVKSPADVALVSGAILTTNLKDFERNFHPSISLVEVLSTKKNQRIGEAMMDDSRNQTSTENILNFPSNEVMAPVEEVNVPIEPEMNSNPEAWEPKAPDLGTLFAPFDSSTQEAPTPNDLENEDEFRMGRAA